MIVRTKLTLQPKLEVSQELLAIDKLLCHTDKNAFVGALTVWHEKMQDSSTNGQRDQTGRHITCIRKQEAHI
ncbi:hypothetical protein CBG57_00180 [Prevotella nigrescens]|nr:hypothetical protein CBG57_00180 [Prevotella nigrescens]RKW55397.1 MAG: hypothetical protein D8B57_03420 [Prevotella sp.]